MRKVMLMAAVMAMVLAAAAPAFAQANAVGGSVQYVDCDQIQAAATGQYNVANNQDLAGIAQELGVSQNQVSACLDSIAAGGDVNIGNDDNGTAYPKKDYGKKVYGTATSYASDTAGKYQYGGGSPAADCCGRQASRHGRRLAARTRCGGSARSRWTSGPQDGSLNSRTSV